MAGNVNAIGRDLRAGQILCSTRSAARMSGVHGEIRSASPLDRRSTCTNRRPHLPVDRAGPEAKGGVGMIEARPQVTG